VSISAVDATGAPRSDWTVQVLYGNITAAEGKGSVNVVLPRTDVLGQPYTVRVVTNVVTPEGKALVKEQALEVTQKALAVQIPISTVRVVAQVVDGFGNVRSDWPIVIENVATGMGRIETEVVEGQRYVARATGLGFTNATVFIAMSPQMVVSVKIPTSIILARVVDGFGQQRDWPVEILGIASGRGVAGPVEVLAGRYTVRAVALGREFVEEVEVAPGQNVVATVQVSTARLSIYVVDDNRKPIDQYVASVEVSGPVAQLFPKPPSDLEVLAGQYTITVTALGKLASSQVTLQPGQHLIVEVLVPGTAGVDIGGTRITYSTLSAILVAVAAVVAAVGFAVVRLRSKKERVVAERAQMPKPTVQREVKQPTEEVCLEYPGGVISLGGYTAVGRRDFSGLPERVSELIDERHFAVYFKDGEWWVEDLGSRHGTYLNGVRVKKERLREGDVISPGAAVAVVFKRCGTARRVVPMEEEAGTKTY